METKTENMPGLACNKNMCALPTFGSKTVCLSDSNLWARLLIVWGRKLQMGLFPDKNMYGLDEKQGRGSGEIFHSAPSGYQME